MADDFLNLAGGNITEFWHSRDNLTIGQQKLLPHISTVLCISVAEYKWIMSINKLSNTYIGSPNLFVT